MLSIAYLTLPQMDNLRSDEDIMIDLMNGSLAFYDYASSCWVLHLLSGITDSSAGDTLIHLRETLETFIEVHFVSKFKPLPVSKKIERSLAPLQDSESYDQISQAIAWAQKQLGAQGQGVDPDEALDLPRITKSIRSVLEDLRIKSVPKNDLEKLEQFYGLNWFKCPRVNCYYYHQGFETLDQREYHIKRHERPFLCVVQGCHMGIFGLVAKDDLRRHMFDCHGLDMFEEMEFPEPAKAKPSNTTKSPALFMCSLCSNSYTRNHNLQAHIRKKHQSAKLEFINCEVCGMSFTRKYERDRHQLVHGDKPHVCFGSLSDGSTWGCKMSFARPDKLADHLKSKTGQACIRPLLLEQLGKENLEDTEMEAEDKAELIPGVLPSFGEFLRLCGLDEEALKLNISPPGASSKSVSG
jgi:Zinc finger, C2H2 type